MRNEKIVVELVLDIPKGELIRIRPHQEAFTLVKDAKSILEQAIIGYYPVLSTGEKISFMLGDTQLDFDIIKTEPCDVIITVDTDLSVDFAPFRTEKMYFQKLENTDKRMDVIKI